jgi:NAD(P)-dependent dehydrogenase (short-subunit alcohol dehydrogenase family)
LKGLPGKVAVVTGGGSGIGAAVAKRLSTEGAQVVVVDADGERGQAVASSLPGEALAVCADVSSEEEVEAYMQAAVERFGRVDLHHLNAGIAGTLAPLPEVSAAEFDEVWAVNVRGVFLGLRAAFRRYAEQGSGGAIVATASLAGLRGSADLVPYHVSKHAVIGLARCAAVHGGPLGIRVNAISPGIIPTGLLSAPDGRASGNPADVRAKSSTPMERVGSPAEVAAMVAFLLSDDAAYVTGGVHPVDGGAGAVNPFRPLPGASR